MKLNAYVDARLERWAAWCVGTGVAIAPWSRMRYGTPTEIRDPPSHDEERETDELLQHFSIGERRFISSLYPAGLRSFYQVAEAADCSIQTVYSTLARLQAEFARMIDQRRKGEEIDPRRKPLRSKAVRIHVEDDSKKKRKRRAIASAMP